MKPKKRVLHVIPSVGGGGTERQLAYLSRGLNSIGWNVCVSYVWPGPNETRIQSGNISLSRMCVYNNYDPRIVFGIAKKIIKWNPDIVHSWLPSMDIQCGLACRILNVPWVLSERASALAYNNSIKESMRRFIGKRARICIANSFAGKSIWTSINPSCLVIPNGIPIHEIDSVLPHCAFASKAWAGDNKLKVLCAGRLNAGKNYKTVIEAVERLSHTHEIGLIICGEGPQRQQIEDWIVEYGMQANVEMVGYLSDHDLWGLMKTAQVFVSASRNEGSPNVVLEAMACGCPIALSDIPEHREVLRDLSAYWFEVDRPDALALNIAQAVTNKIMTAIHTSSARKLVEKLSVTTMVNRYDRVYNEILSLSNHSQAKRR